MNNQYLFELLGASGTPSIVTFGLATAVSNWLILILPFGLILYWVLSKNIERIELLESILATAFSIAILQVIVAVFPLLDEVFHITQAPRSFSFSQLSNPSISATVFWAIGFYVLTTDRLAIWGFLFLAVGLLVSWSSVYLRANYPYDFVASLPVSFVSAFVVHAQRSYSRPFALEIVAAYNRNVGIL